MSRLLRFSPTQILISLLLTLLPRTQLEQVQARALTAGDLAGDFLSLGGGNSEVKSAAAREKEQQEMLGKIMQDDVGGEFALTEQMIRFLDQSLGQFAAQEQIGQDMIASGQPVVQWVRRKGIENFDPYVGKEMNYVFANYEKIKSLIMKVVTESPKESGLYELAYRCKQHDALKAIKELASQSSCFMMLTDIFSAELYNHCLVRKIAVIRVTQVVPSSTVKQFVDIYREGNLRDGFDLQLALTNIGPLQSASSLVLDPKSISLGTNDRSGAQELITRFKSECQQHCEKLQFIWGDMDQVAEFLSSPMNNLSQYNSQMKFSAPQLAYGSICNQLASKA